MVKIGRLNLKNPVMTASGTFGYGEEYEQFFDINKLGAIITKTITLKPRAGNPPPRIWETPSGLINSIGLQNDGVEDFIRNKIPRLRKIKTIVIASIAGEGASEYAELARRISKAGVVAGLELNLSCPNIKRKIGTYPLFKMGCVPIFSQDEKATYDIVAAVRRATKLTVIAKLTPNVTDITSIAKSAEDAGADAVSLINTFPAMAFDVEKGIPRLGAVTGGLSGPAIRPIAIKMVYDTTKAVKIPVIGIGGIMTSDDAIEFLIAGAKAVQIGTANFINPKATLEVIDGIKKFQVDSCA